MPTVSVSFDTSYSTGVPPFGATGNIDVYNFDITFSVDDLWVLNGHFEPGFGPRGDFPMHSTIFYKMDISGRRADRSWGMFTDMLHRGLNMNQAIASAQGAWSARNEPAFPDLSLSAMAGGEYVYQLDSISDDGAGTTIFNQKAYCFRSNVSHGIAPNYLLPFGIYCPTEAALVFGSNAIGIEVVNINGPVVRPMYKSFGSNVENNSQPREFVASNIKFSGDVEDRKFHYGPCVTGQSIHPSIYPGTANDFARPIQYLDGSLPDQVVRAPIGATLYGYPNMFSPGDPAWTFVGGSSYFIIASGPLEIDFTSVTGKTLTVTASSVASLTNGGMAAGDLVTATAPALAVFGPANPALVADYQADSRYLPSPFATMRGDWMPGVNLVGTITASDMP